MFEVCQCETITLLSVTHLSYSLNFYLFSLFLTFFLSLSHTHKPKTPNSQRAQSNVCLAAVQSTPPDPESKCKDRTPGSTSGCWLVAAFFSFSLSVFWPTEFLNLFPAFLTVKMKPRSNVFKLIETGCLYKSVCIHAGVYKCSFLFFIAAHLQCLCPD